MKALLRLIALYKPYAGWVLLSILVSLAATLANIGLMATSGWFITAMAAAGLAHAEMNYFTPAGIIRFFAILRTGGRYLDRIVSHEATFRLLARFRGAVFAALEPLAPGALADMRSGDVSTRLGADVDRLELVFLRFLAPLAVAILSSAAVVAFLALYSPRIAAVVGLALAVAGMALPAFAAVLGRRPAARIADLNAAMRTTLVDDLEGLAPLMFTGADRRHVAALEGRMDALVAEETRLARAEGLGMVGVGLSGDLAALGALVLGIPLVVAGTLSAPDLTMATLLALSAFEALTGVPGAFAGLSGSIASARRMFALMDRAPLVRDPARPAPAPERFDIAYRNVGLTYDGAARPALSDVDLAIPQGRRIAIVGQSGAGKSSLVDLLLRFRDPTQGSIALGGVPLSDLAEDDLRARIVAIVQAPHLFTATLAENLRLAAPKVSDATLAGALKTVALDALLAELPEGLATPIGTAGTRLSGGEGRRLALARGLLSSAPVLVLDEPTEGLDAATERRVLTGLLDAADGRTVIMLTHRMAALEKMDEIVVLEDGCIAERGPLDALIASGGAFSRLFDRLDAEAA